MLLSGLNFIQTNEPLYWIMLSIWISVFIITLFIELNTADLTIIWFCIASLVSFILALFGISYIIQIIVFVVISLVLLIATRPLTKNMMNKTLIRTNADRIISSIGIVTKAINPDDVGEVKVGSDYWRAISADNTLIEENEKVTIISFSGNKVIVSKVNRDQNINII